MRGRASWVGHVDSILVAVRRGGMRAAGWMLEQSGLYTYTQHMSIHAHTYTHTRTAGWQPGPHPILGSADHPPDTHLALAICVELCRISEASADFETCYLSILCLKHVFGWLKAAVAVSWASLPNFRYVW